jgi:ABC-type cobalamin/Fe3+-siderophores transport system ATPase subunit
MSQTPISFQDVSFFYSQLEEDETPNLDPSADREPSPAVEDPQSVTQVFSGLSLELPAGVTSLVGQNGIGKSTFLLLAGGRLLPTTGRVLIGDADTAELAGEGPEVEERRNRLASFIYQNMEFETEDPVGDLMGFVLENGYHRGLPQGFLEDVQSALGLEELLGKKTQELAKGELQRTIIAFSLLYGSSVILMDEPVFALEDERKSRVFEYLMDYSARYGVSIYYSAHDLHLTEKYSDYLLLFWKNGGVQLGPTGELFTRENIEQAYQVPFQMLYRKEYLFREMMMKISGAHTEGEQ